jgi:hypothetical protein
VTNNNKNELLTIKHNNEIIHTTKKIINGTRSL